MKRHKAQIRKNVLWCGNAPGGNYTEIVTRAIQEVIAKHGPRVYEAAILHDDGCALLVKKLPCNCFPEIQVLGEIDNG